MAAPQTAAYQHVLAQATELPPDDKLRLLETLAAQVRHAMSPSKGHHVTEFRGIGHASWDGTDAQEYVNQERDGWDG